ncbi:PH domain-containing protein [Modestobacter sp. I12A-02628]|uniref:PH domain-containing protein n=1 Tax=Goekera deserti TaxID=2497753 RepID=A0A7K3WJK6_9ACTN|nr:PH domain-containing protein [Goekera deserti]MPQ97333.1 PH domain-containing protein [Goekera deserti]NDI50155.1 PH domain-containing protein [Goekera deserti]NEL55723.1 PH domain-containing protein [Goekera deserti]
MPTARFRMNQTMLLPVGMLAICVLPFALGSPWTAVFLLVPVVAGAWVRRSGVDVGEDAVTARSLVGSRRVPWTDVLGIRVSPAGELWLVTRQGTEVRLPAVRARDLPVLSRFSGGRIDVPAAPESGPA